MIRRILALSALALALTALPAAANALREMPLSEQTERADTVVVGRVVSMEAVPGQGQWAIVDVRATIKGTPDARIKVQTIGNFAEFSYPDCRPGDEYVLFLFKDPADGDYGAVDGRFSFVRLKP